MELAIHRAPLNELVFEVDPDLQVTAVRLGNLDVNWVAAASEDGRSQTVRVRFAERLTGVHPTLQLFAVGPLHTGESWRLPTLRPQNVFWRQGTMSLIVPESLELRHLSVHNARQAGVAAPQDGLAGDVTRFELFGVDGALEVNIARQGRELVADVGTTIDLDPGAVTSQTLADVRCRFGERFVIEARVPNTWTIDGIDAQLAMIRRERLSVCGLRGRPQAIANSVGAAAGPGTVDSVGDSRPSDPQFLVSCGGFPSGGVSRRGTSLAIGRHRAGCQLSSGSGR